MSHRNHVPLQESEALKVGNLAFRAWASLPFCRNTSASSAPVGAHSATWPKRSKAKAAYAARIVRIWYISWVWEYRGKEVEQDGGGQGSTRLQLKEETSGYQERAPSSTRHGEVVKSVWFIWWPHNKDDHVFMVTVSIVLVSSWFSPTTIVSRLGRALLPTSHVHIFFRAGARRR